MPYICMQRSNGFDYLPRPSIQWNAMGYESLGPWVTLYLRQLQGWCGWESLGGQELPKNSLSPLSTHEYLKISMQCWHLCNLLVTFLQCVVTLAHQVWSVRILFALLIAVVDTLIVFVPPSISLARCHFWSFVFNLLLSPCHCK